MLWKARGKAHPLTYVARKTACGRPTQVLPARRTKRNAIISVHFGGRIERAITVATLKIVPLVSWMRFVGFAGGARRRRASK